MMKKKIIITVIIVTLFIPVSFFFYISLSMKPLKSGSINEHILVFNDGFVNWFLVRGDTGYIAIDSGNSPAKVSRELMKFNIDPSEVLSVFLTHSDGDHIGGLSIFTHSDIFLPEKEEPMILGKDFRKIFGKKMSGKSPLSQRDYTLLTDHTEMKLDGVSIKTVSVPGHSSGSTAYIINDSVAFTGDMAIISGKTLKPLPPFINNDQKQAQKTIERFVREHGNLKLIATSHDGLLYPPFE